MQQAPFNPFGRLIRRFTLLVVGMVAIQGLSLIGIVVLLIRN